MSVQKISKNLDFIYKNISHKIRTLTKQDKLIKYKYYIIIIKYVIIELI